MVSPPAPPPLDYQPPHAPAKVLEERYGCAPSILLLTNALLGGAMALAVLFVDRVGAAAWLMLGSGVLTIFVVLGRLSGDWPRFGQAVVLALIACAAAGSALALTLAAAENLEAEIVGNRTGPVVVYLETDRGALLATLRLAWQLSAAAVTATFLLAVYAGWRMARVRRARRAADLAEGV